MCIPAHADAHASARVVGRGAVLHGQAPTRHHLMGAGAGGGRGAAGGGGGGAGVHAACPAELAGQRDRRPPQGAGRRGWQVCRDRPPPRGTPLLLWQCSQHTEGILQAPAIAVTLLYYAPKRSTGNMSMPGMILRVQEPASAMQPMQMTMQGP